MYQVEVAPWYLERGVDETLGTEAATHLPDALSGRNRCEGGEMDPTSMNADTRRLISAVGIVAGASRATVSDHPQYHSGHHLLWHSPSRE